MKRLEETIAEVEDRKKRSRRKKEQKSKEKSDQSERPRNSVRKSRVVPDKWKEMNICDRAVPGNLLVIEVVSKSTYLDRLRDS